ncbi:putative response regulatory protein [Blautia producta]|uniref:Stage 0 sporulation protein A homolog n=1 Tax=Blautia producta TaxID=33035 RepID=A0A4P6LZN5_9FIRM|nr:response regulator [Blautia producta]QBE97255.1 putative response regulatory protein [Blautia producta]
MEKIKIFLVDDEAIILKGLETTYSWDKMGAVVVGTSRNPRKAVDEILEKRPDIVITDIRMKQMTGLDLIQEVNGRAEKKCLWIVISAYRDFEYAQKACELGAFTYLLKPIEDSKLEEAVQSAAKTIRQNRKSRKILQDYEHFIENNKKVFENYMVGKFSGDQIDEEELQEALERFGGKNRDAFFYRAVCMDFVRVFDEKNRQSVTQEEIAGFLEHDLGEAYQYFYFQNESGYRIMILSASRGEYLVLPVLEREMELLKQKFSVDLRYGISGTGRGIKGLKETYVQAVENLEQADGKKRDMTELDQIRSHARTYISQAISYVQEHLDDEFLSVGMAAREVHLNPVYFGRLFGQGMQRSFKQYLLEERIRLAKSLLKTTDDTITEICEKVGIPNPSYFTQQFKKHVGCLPTEYRKEMYEEK